MSQSGLSTQDAGNPADPCEREAAWDRWYVDHLKIMLTVNGIDSAQRFKTASSGHSPSLAMYTIASQAVFSDAYYQKIRGMGEWAPLIVKEHYRRNLFDGRDAAPAVADDEALLVFDRPVPDALPTGIAIEWLWAVGLDRSTPYRGIAVVKQAAVAGLINLGDAGVYTPATPYRRRTAR